MPLVHSEQWDRNNTEEDEIIQLSFPALPSADP